MKERGRHWRLKAGKDGKKQNERKKERERSGRFTVYMEERLPKKSILSLSACSRKPAP